MKIKNIKKISIIIFIIIILINEIYKNYYSCKENFTVNDTITTQLNNISNQLMMVKDNTNTFIDISNGLGDISLNLL